MQILKLACDIFFKKIKHLVYTTEVSHGIFILGQMFLNFSVFYFGKYFCEYFKFYWPYSVLLQLLTSAFIV